MEERKREWASFVEHCKTFEQVWNDPEQVIHNYSSYFSLRQRKVTVGELLNFAILLEGGVVVPERQ